jgi:hypothetical protein
MALPVIVMGADTGKPVLAGRHAATLLLAKPFPRDTLRVVARFALAAAPRRICP